MLTPASFTRTILIRKFSLWATAFCGFTAGFIEHLACELGLPLTSVVNDGGASTLVRQELSRKPALLRNKKLVVWEFVERDIRFGTEGWQQVQLPPAQ